MISRRISFPISILVLIVSALACAQTPSSDASLRDIACALQGISPSSCNPPLAGGGAAGDSGGTPLSPSKLETLVPTLTPTPTVAPKNSLRVVYVKGGNIWFWDNSAALPTQLTNSGQDSTPRLSDDGLVIAFRRKGELWAVNSDGRNERVLASGSALAVLSPAGAKAAQPRQFDFAPHSHDVYLNITVVGAPFSVPEYNLARVNADSPSLQALLDGSQGGGQFIFSPDGTKIALSRNDKINVANPDGSNLKTVFTFPRVLLHSDANYLPQILWMPDGSGFTTVIPPEDGMNHPSDRTRLYYISADGGQPAQLAEFVAAPALQSQPCISPDGSKVLYTKPQGANLELHVIDVSTTDQMYFWYAANNIGLLGWAPDSKQVMYWLDDSRRAWLASPGKEPVLLSDVAFAVNITWVDPRRYLFLNGSEFRLRMLGQPSILIDNNLSESTFDFSFNPGN